ncbi:MAG: alpha/beta hydrolase [bacterium]|nr:alpha/beta hydrolase [Gammaproteobacteria bacterium]HIL96627.1 alpha/beta hydrolase [Pseudomonadales bacterium]
MDNIKFSMIESNSISIRIAEAGTGPLVLLVHGWPESWYSWRHQVTGLAAAGYRVIAPDMRGYGDTDAPADPAEYRIDKLAADLVGILDAVNEQTAVLVGHDWGSMVVWNAAVLHPDRFTGVIGMSVPYGGVAKQPPLDNFKKLFGDSFFYILYHNEEAGVAEKEYDSDPRRFISMLYASPDTPRHDPTITDPKRSAGGWFGRIGAPKELPDWLTEEDLDYYVNEFTRAGFRGGVNYYRNFNTNWDLMKDVDPMVKIPSAFISGSADMVIAGADEAGLRKTMSPVMSDLREVTLLPGKGHWVQQEDPAGTNEAILRFLKSLES